MLVKKRLMSKGWLEMTDKPETERKTVRTRTGNRTPKAKVTAPSNEEVKVTEPQKTTPTEEVETVVLKEETPAVQITQSDIAAAISASSENDEQVRYGNSGYKIGNDPKSMVKLTNEKLTYYPLHIWARNPGTLENYGHLAAMRMLDGSASEKDLEVLDFAEQNKVNEDRHFFSFFAQPEGDWDDHLRVGERKVRSNTYNFRTKATGGELANNEDQLLTVLCRRLEMGLPLLVRLWHTGIVFAIAPVEKGERVAMVDKLNNAHLETLRRTNGIIHGTSTYYANRIIIESFMKLVRDSNIEKSLHKDITTMLDHRDIQIMAWALMAASYQRGYNFVETCGNLKPKVDAEGKPVLTPSGEQQKTICSHNESSIIDLSLIVQIDNSKYTDWQRDFISQPLSDTKKYTREDIEKYQRMGKMHETDCVEIVDGVSVLIKAPTADKHLTIGEDWIAAVEESVEGAILSNADDTTRGEMIQRQIEQTAMLDVAHWVIGFNIDGEEIISPTGVKKSFRMLSNNEQLRDKLYVKIREHLAKRMAAVVAVPTKKCEGCGGLSNVIANNGTMIYTPIDMVSRFFTLTARNP